MKPIPDAKSKIPSPRVTTRAQCIREISVMYEGIRETIFVKPPNLSLGGMFISTNRVFPEGAVLNLRFRLARTGKEVRTRAEVRHCEPGVGVGVEFIDASPEARRNIADEIALNEVGQPRILAGNL